MLSTVPLALREGGMVKAWTVKSSTGRDRYERQTVGRYERRCLPYAFELFAEKKTKSSGR
jgi:hypothetical protein